MKKKVLIITYYWPPVGGSGVQRWLKMSRYLPDFGWEPVIFTPENPSFGTIDKSLENDVPKDAEIIKFPIWEPYHIFGKFKGKKGPVSAADVSIKQNKTFLDKLLLWVRGNLFIPDPRVFWVKPSANFLAGIIESNNISAVITTGPPHSMHLIGKRLKKKTGLKWIADFRDPWTEWDLYNEFYMLAPTRWLHKRMERNVLRNADAVLSTNNLFSQQFETLGDRPVQVVSNGFDEADFKNYTKQKSGVFTIRYIGILDEMRDPSSFLIALENFIKNNKEASVLVEFIGNVAGVYKEKISENPVLKNYVNLKPYQPHSDIINMYSTTDVLLLVLTQSDNAAGNTPGKLYEYLASGSDILSLGPPEGEVGQILQSTGAGVTVNHNEVNEITTALQQFYNKYLSGEENINIDISQFSRRSQARKVGEILDSLVI